VTTPPFNPILWSDLVRALRDACDAFADKGSDFELVVQDLLREFGFVNVRRQLSGTQFGRDLAGDLPAERGAAKRWHFEAKNKDVITSRDVAEKLLWKTGNGIVGGGFAIVGPGTLSNDLNELLSETSHPFRFPIYDWTGEAFAKIVACCPASAARWFPAVSIPAAIAQSISHLRAELLRTSNAGGRAVVPLHASLYPVFDPPFQRAYWLQNDNVISADSSAVGFEHQLLLESRADHEIVIRRVRLRTLSWRALPGRMLLLNKMKGLIDPLVLTYDLVPEGGAEVDALARKSWRMHPGSADAFVLRLGTHTPAGLYDVEVLVDLITDGSSITATAGRFEVCVDPSSAADILSLWVWRRFPDRAAEEILRRPDQWNRLREPENASGLLFLGPTMYDDMEGRRLSWRVQRVPMKTSPSGNEADFIDDAELLLELGDIADEYRSDSPVVAAEKLANVVNASPADVLHALGTRSTRTRLSR
jgi:hypothetical protein